MAILAKVYRGSQEDLIHQGRIAVADYKGNILYSLGKYNKMTFARSAAKPIQAIAVAESDAIEKYKITDKELAVICASHNAESFHVEAVREILRKAGLNENDLKCGSHYPIAQYVKDEFVSKNVKPTSIHSDCSGKHAGMLITAKAYGENTNDYYHLDSNVQQRILNIISDVCEYEREKIGLAVDGCGVPVHAMPLYRLAQGYAKLSIPEIFNKKRCDAIKKITGSMTSHPEMVAGTKRFCTDLMNSFGDRLFGKSGAGSFYAIGLKNKGIGIAVKIEDGCSEYIPPVVISVLFQLNVIDEYELKKLNQYLDYNIYNYKNEIVGFKRIDFKLKSHKI